MLERKVLEYLHPTRHLYLERNGTAYAVHEGPSWPTFSAEKNLFGVPQEPHVMEISDFTLTEGANNSVLLGLTDTNIRVLDMHGVWRNNNWYPLSRRLQENGITIPNIVEDYEARTGKKIDIISACTRDAQLTSEMMFADDKVYLRRGGSRGLTTTRFDTGGLSLTMHVGKKNDVEYEGWLNRRLGKVIINSGVA